MTDGLEILAGMMESVPEAPANFRVREGVEIRAEASAFIRAQAALLSQKASAESLKGAANTQMISAYQWAAQFLADMASTVDTMELIEVLEAIVVEEPLVVTPDPNRLSPEGASEPNRRVLIDAVAATAEPLENPYVADGAAEEADLSKPASDEDEDVPDEESSDPATVSTEPAKRGRGRPPKTAA